MYTKIFLNNCASTECGASNHYAVECSPTEVCFPRILCFFDDHLCMTDCSTAYVVICEYFVLQGRNEKLVFEIIAYLKLCN